MAVYFTLVYLQTALSILVATLALFRFRRREVATRILGILFLAGTLANLTALVLMKIPGLGGLVNTPSTIYDLLLVPLVSYFYFLSLGNRYGGVLASCAILYLLFGVVNSFFIQQTEIASNTKLIASLIITGYALQSFYRMMVEMPAVHITRVPFFWFNSGFLFYHAGTIFLFAFVEYLVKVLKDNMIIYWTFHNLLSILEHMLIVVGLLYQLKAIRNERTSTVKG